MALKDRIRKAVSSSTSSSRKESTSTTAPASPASSSPPSSGFTTPTVSRQASSAALPALLPSATLNLTKTTSTTSKLSLSRFRSNTTSSSSSKKQNWAKYAPKNYRFKAPNPEHVAALSAWEWSFGANSRASVCSALSGISPSRNPSLDMPRALHVEDAAAP